MKRMQLAGSLMVATGLMMSAPVAPAVDLIESLPEQTLLAFGVRDFSELKTKFEASRYHDAWQSPELENLRTTVDEQWVEFSDTAEEEIGLRPDRILSHFQGAFVAHGQFMGLNEEGDVLASFGLMAEVPSDAQAALRTDVEQLLEKAATDATKSMETFRGVDIYRIQFTRQIDLENPEMNVDIDMARPFDIQYAFTDELFLLAEGKNDPLKVMLTSLDADATTTVGRSSGFQAVKNEIGDIGDTQILVNFPQIFSVLEQERTGAEAKDVIEKLGLTHIGPALISVSLTDYGMLQEVAMPVPSEKKGLLAILDAGQPLRLDTARLVPADASTFVSWTLDVKQMWDAMYAMILDFSPEAENFIGYGFLTAQSNFEIDVENDILSHIKGEHSFWMKPLPEDAAVDEMTGMPPQNPQTLFLGLEDGQATVDALNRLFRRLTGDEYNLPVEETEVRGVTVWSPSEDVAGELPVQSALGISPTGLILTSSMLDMQEVLRQVSGDASSATITSDAEFQGLYEGLPKDGLRMLGYSSPRVYKDFDKQMDAMFFAFQMMAEGALPFEREDIPSSEWFMRYFGPSIQAAYMKPEMLRIHQKSITAK